MKAIISSNNAKHPPGDALVLPFWKAEKGEKAGVQYALKEKPVKLLKKIAAPLACHDFTGKEGETLVLYTEGEPEPRLILLGLGERSKANIERLRRAYAALTKMCQAKKFRRLHLFFPFHPDLSAQDIARGIAEGLFLTNYLFNKLKTKKPSEENLSLLEQVVFLGAPKAVVSVVQKAQVICEGVHFARNLVNDNADTITPQELAKVAQKLAKAHSALKVTLFNKTRLEKEKMGLLLAVSRGSACDPVFIQLHYPGNPSSKEHVVLVGKGVTYDTGGLNLKPTGSMETMRADMAGAAALLAVLEIAARLGLKQNLTVVIPTTENSIDGRSFKPGDIYSSYSGKTVEIGNTDAEGRLILADALAYAVKNLAPTCIIDVATLTGAMDIALGPEGIGLMANSDQLAEQFCVAGEATYERVCHFPLYEEYRERLKSDFADLKNIGGRSGGAILAGLFLQEFVGQVPWVHLDIASPAYLSESRRYHPKNGTGCSVRLLIEFLERM